MNTPLIFHMLYIFFIRSKLKKLKVQKRKIMVKKIKKFYGKIFPCITFSLNEIIRMVITFKQQNLKTNPLIISHVEELSKHHLIFFLLSHRSNESYWRNKLHLIFHNIGGSKEKLFCKLTIILRQLICSHSVLFWKLFSSKR
jgi:hypothetical protein